MNEKSHQGAEDSARYFRYMADFIGFSVEDAEIIKRTKPVIEKHLPDIVSKFYSHLLRYHPRKYFLKADGTLDQEYIGAYAPPDQLATECQGFSWVCRYVDYIGRRILRTGLIPVSTSQSVM
jgi:hypothetical protein